MKQPQEQTGFQVTIRGKERYLPRGLNATLRAPGNPQEAAFANGYKNVSKNIPVNSYGKLPMLKPWFQAGRTQARADQRAQEKKHG